LSKNIMIQGTSSSAGKSILTTSLCRIFANRGMKVAPFKSQNMTRNKVKLKDGTYIAGSQVVQSESAKTEPIYQMNPVLLVPKTDTGSTLILKGVEHGDYDAKTYYREKMNFRPAVEESYNELKSKYELIVIEGAGSPAEINLRENDYVNMGLAHMVDAPVVLVGDIERGGVFASIYGTAMILSESDRERIKGFVINKFRGDVDILKPGIEELEDRTGIPCLGVIPYMDINIEEEDSLVDGKRGERIDDELLREEEYDRLARFVESYIDMEKLEEIIGVGR
jgi:adenosylcobyric acid synthase